MSTHTHIPVVRWINHGCDKLYGTIVVDGAMSAEKLTELKSYLDAGRGFIPARLNGIDLDNLSGMWHELRVDDAQVLDTDRVCGWEDIEPEHVGMSEFVDAMRAASQQGWKSDKELKRDRRAARKQQALDVLRAFGAARAALDECPADVQRLINGAVTLAESIAETTREGAIGPHATTSTRPQNGHTQVVGPHE